VIARDLLIVVCAISAGIHAALAPGHFSEGTAAGVGFLAATLVLAALAIVLTRRPEQRPAVVGAAVVLAGLLGSYALAATTGLPLLHPDSEPVDGLALGTKAFEAVGLLAASHLLRRRQPTVASVLPPLGLTALIGCFSALAALAISDGHGAHAHGHEDGSPTISRTELG
jgi:drug/metabolite transporter (DMT)-like permease